MEDGVDAAEKRPDRARAQVGVHELEVRVRARRRDVAVLLCRFVVGREAVDTADDVTARQQRVGQVTPDEDRGPRDQRAHQDAASARDSASAGCTRSESTMSTTFRWFVTATAIT